MGGVSVPVLKDVLFPNSVGMVPDRLTEVAGWLWPKLTAPYMS
jgi:hypothetical protein